MSKLIISTGDNSDVSIFFALAEYAKTGADVLFIVNYPAHVGTKETEANTSYHAEYPGLGFKYSSKDVFEAAPIPAPEEYIEFLGHYRNLEANDLMKAAITDIAFSIARKVWSEGPEHRGNLYFCIGGINVINPFSAASIKNEILIYSKCISKARDAAYHGLCADEGAIYDMKGNQVDLDWSQHKDIYLDFNGSMAFLNPTWMLLFSDASVVRRMRGVFVKGGVYAEEAPLTMPAIPNVLNHFGSATMNQLYHPEHTARFFEFVSKHAIPTFTVTNNVVDDLSTFAGTDNKVCTMKGVDAFLRSNAIGGPFLRAIAHRYFSSLYNPPHQACSFYTAAALRANLEGRTVAYTPRLLYYSEIYGAALVSNLSTWEATLSSYAASTETASNAEDFRRELELLKVLAALPSVAVRDVAFTCNPVTYKLSPVTFHRAPFARAGDMCFSRVPSTSTGPADRVPGVSSAADGPADRASAGTAPAQRLSKPAPLAPGATALCECPCPSPTGAVRCGMGSMLAGLLRGRGGLGRVGRRHSSRHMSGTEGW